MSKDASQDNGGEAPCDETTMDALPDVDPSLLEHNDQMAQEKVVRKNRRVELGFDRQYVDGDEEAVRCSEGAQTMSLEERERRWGFTKSELDTATKVVGILFRNPTLFVGDPILAETRLFTMLSRDRDTKRKNEQALKRIMAEEKARKTAEKRQQDIETIRKTQMKQEREAALQALLLPPASEGGSRLIEDSVPQANANDEAPAAAPVASPCSENSEGCTPSASGTAAADAPLKMNREQTCHICKQRYTELHRYYYSLCIPCGDFNYAKRNAFRDLSGKNILLTGCRIKIGYAMALSLLRCGATVIGTTRFSHDALARFQQESDFEHWKERIHLYSLDLRDLWMVQQFTAFLKTRYRALFAIINNAAQTIARPTSYTENLRSQEVRPPPAVHRSLFSNANTAEWVSFFNEYGSVKIGEPLKISNAKVSNLPAAIDGGGTSCSEHAEAPAQPSSLGVPAVYDRYDTAAEVSDARQHNTWTLNLHQVSGSEATEVMAINALAPFILNARLKPIMLQPSPATATDKQEARFIVNVSAMEGQFYRYKQTTHPHTNMAKAALNMMTRTSAEDYAKDNIFMNSVDTGWITDESPMPKRVRRADNMMLCPLDEVDAAARCLDLIYTDSHEYGKFWKDFKVIPW